MNMTIKKKNSNCSKKPKINASKYDEAKKYIRSAIQVLGESATASDAVAKDSIANLSVVLMDLN